MDDLKCDTLFLGIDTLVKNFGDGNENDTADVSHVLENIDRYLKEPFRALVVALMHPGHGNERRPRGSSAILPGVDMAVRMARTRVGARIECVRRKNGPPFSTIHTKSRLVSWRDAGGAKQTGIVLDLVKDSGEENPEKASRASKSDRLLDLLKQLRHEKFLRLRPRGKSEDQIGILPGKLKDAAVAAGLINTSIARQDFFKQKSKLLATGEIKIAERRIGGALRSFIYTER
jgi:hypothetical protein